METLDEYGQQGLKPRRQSRRILPWELGSPAPGKGWVRGCDTRRVWQWHPGSVRDDGTVSRVHCSSSEGAFSVPRGAAEVHWLFLASGAACSPASQWLTTVALSRLYHLGGSGWPQPCLTYWIPEHSRPGWAEGWLPKGAEWMTGFKPGLVCDSKLLLDWSLPWASIKSSATDHEKGHLGVGKSWFLGE